MKVTVENMIPMEMKRRIMTIANESENKDNCYKNISHYIYAFWCDIYSCGFGGSHIWIAIRGNNERVVIITE